MIDQALLTEYGLEDRRLVRGVVSATEDGRFLVRVQRGDEEWLVSADLLCTSETPVRLQPNDSVLCWIENDEHGRAVILGRIGDIRSTANDVASPEGGPPIARGAPDTLVLEAKHSLTLRVGAGSITIREDGKILIKGKDLVSHAQRLNRIKGGAVQIN